MPANPLRRRAPALLLPLASTLLLAACSETATDTHPQRLVSQRQAVFKDFTRTLEPMSLVARGRQPYDAVAFLASAQQLQALSARPWAFFTPDGNYPPTRALPAVWSQPEDFKRAQEDYLAAVALLVQTAQTGQLEPLRTAVGDVQQRCKACHERFRGTLPAGSGG